MPGVSRFPRLYQDRILGLQGEEETTTFVLGLATSALAATGQFDNLCAEGLSLHKQIKTDCSVNANLDGKTYCFGNGQAKQDFMKDPKANLSRADAYYQSQHHG
jgi:YHS domain-containing protein